MVRLRFAIVVISALVATVASAQNASVTINSIQRDVRITGQVLGIPVAELSRYKVVVYVETDRWYVHPYADGGDGKSWASIASDGSWKIGTVKRDFPAKKVAAAVVPSDYKAPPRLYELNALPTRAVIVRDLEGQPGYGDL